MYVKLNKLRGVNISYQLILNYVVALLIRVDRLQWYVVATQSLLYGCV